VRTPALALAFTVLAASPAHAQTTTDGNAVLVTALVLEGLLIGGGMVAATVNAWQISEGTNTPRGARGVVHCMLIGMACAFMPFGNTLMPYGACGGSETASDYGYLFGTGNALVGGTILSIALSTSAAGTEPFVALGGAQLGVGLVTIGIALAADLYPMSRIPSSAPPAYSLVPVVTPDGAGAAVRVAF
jgi:hypothetical protein